MPTAPPEIPAPEHPHAPRAPRVNGANGAGRARMPDRLPCDIAAERHVTGGLIGFGALAVPHVDTLAPADFMSPPLACVFEAALALARTKRPFMTLDVLEQLRSTDDLRSLKHVAGGESDAEALDFLDQLMVAATPVVEVLAFYARSIRDLARRRRLIEYHDGARIAALDASTPVDDVLEQDRVALGELGLDRPRSVLPPINAAAAARADWARVMPPAVKSGLPSLDRALGGGLRAESMYVINGATGRGKSALGIQIARVIASKKPFVYFTSELSRRQVIARVAAQIQRRPWSEVFDLGPSEAEAIADTLRALPVLFVEELARDTGIVDVLKRVADVTGEAPIVGLDYIQHAARRLNPEDRRLATGALSDELGRWARDARSTVILLSAAGRPWHGDQGDRSASDYVTAGKETSDIELDARGVLFLEVPDCPPGGSVAAKLHVSKSTFSSTGGTIGLRFHGALGLFEEDKEAALTELELKVIEIVKAGEVTSANQIAEALKKNRPKVLAVVGRLLNSGFLKRSLGRIIATPLTDHPVEP